MRAFSGVVAYVIFCAKAIFGGLCYNFFGTQGWNLSPHCRAANRHGDKMRQKNSLSDHENTRTERSQDRRNIFENNIKVQVCATLHV